MVGVRLMLTQPQLPTCEECQQWIFDLKTGEQATRGGVPTPRPTNLPPPCGTCPKVPAGEEARPHPESDLSPQNWLAYQHYRECRAVGQFPDDDRVRRNAAIIRTIEDATQAGHAINVLKLLGETK